MDYGPAWISVSQVDPEVVDERPQKADRNPPDRPRRGLGSNQGMCSARKIAINWGSTQGGKLWDSSPCSALPLLFEPYGGIPRLQPFSALGEPQVNEVSLRISVLTGDDRTARIQGDSSVRPGRCSWYSNAPCFFYLSEALEERTLG